MFLVILNLRSATVKPNCPTDQQAIITNDDGSYLKTICVVRKAKTHSESYNFCASYGYKLLVIESSNTQTQIFNALTKWFGVSSVLWIDGIRKNGTDDDWYYYSYEKTLVSRDLNWQSSPAMSTGCLNVFSSKTSWFVRGNNCTDTANAVCEHKNGTSATVITRKFSSTQLDSC